MTNFNVQGLGVAQDTPAYKALCGGPKPINSGKFIEFKSIGGVPVRIDKNLYKKGGYKPESIDGGLDVIELNNGIKVGLIPICGDDSQVVISQDTSLGTQPPVIVFSGKNMDLRIDARNSRPDIIGIAKEILADVIIEDGDIAQTQNLFVRTGGKK